MLRIYIDNCIDTLPNEVECYVSDYFDDAYEPEWFRDQFVREIIKEIDNSEVVGDGDSVNIYNDVLGNMPPQYLSSGCKGLRLLYKEGIAINGDRLGDNCIPFLLKIADSMDCTISLGHIPPFPDHFNAIILNNDTLISTMREFVSEFVRLT